MAIVGWTLFWLLTAYQWILILRAVFSWIQFANRQWTPRGVVLVVAEAVFTLTDPPLKFLRKLVKPLRLGSIHLDMAFLVLFVIVLIGLRVVGWVFF